MSRPDRRHRNALGVVFLALVAYLPALASSPGRMPADTKLGLYLDPAGLTGRASSTFEAELFAGWVPHQQITYLWPSGPWYLLADVAGIPDWVAHRLWIGTILFAAGTGVLWLVRTLGLGTAGALVAALAYQCSPYLLPYISRTSLLLLPWAALGWLVGLTVRATRRRPDDPTGRAPEPGAGTGAATGIAARLAPWREPALIALVVATVGSPNATTLVLIAPGPALWLVHAAWGRLVTWRRALGIALRTAALCLAVSLWWVAMLVVQSRRGAPVLAFSETVEDVSRTASGPEVLRGAGYWLFYVQDAFGRTTTAALPYLVSTRALALSFAVGVVGLAGIALVRWPARRFAGLLALAGIVLAVGVHPFGDPSPLMSLLAGDGGSGIALALRSSTRAAPLLVLGLALGLGALVAAVPPRAVRIGALRASSTTLAAVLAGVLVVANLQPLWQFDLVDPAIDRDAAPPAAWVDAARALDAEPDGGRVLQLPGAEFGAFRWGYTVDQPLPEIGDRALVTRDLLPLGSAAAMDLLYALDDRFQDGTAEVAAVAPVARLLGADTIWITGDAEFERFRTARPEVVDAELTAAPAGSGLGPARPFGAPVANDPAVPMLDPEALADPWIGAPVHPVTLVGVADPLGVARLKDRSVVLSGSGDGIIDAAAAGLLSGHELVRYSAALDPDELADAIDAADLRVITDSNRDRAHHWRGSQDVHGHTEPGGPDDDVLDATAADQRLDVFGVADPDVQTVAVPVGPVRATASSYGEPFAYLPEHRAAMAIDGDPDTAWTVGEHGDPLGERIRLVADAPTSALTLLQAERDGRARSIDTVRIRAGGHPPVDITLDDTSRTPPGQEVALPDVPAGTPIQIEITGIVPGAASTGHAVAAVGFAELDLGLGPTTEFIRPPIDAVAASETPLAVVLTRLRVEPTDAWRSDPEPELRRIVELAEGGAFDVSLTLRLDARADDALLAALLAGVPATDGTTVPAPAATVAGARLTGAPSARGAAATDGDPATAWLTPFDRALGARLRIPLRGPLGPELRMLQPGGATSPVTALRLHAGGEIVDLAVPPPAPDGTSAIALPAPLGAAALDGIELEITGIDAVTTVDRRFGDRRVLPAGIAELDAPGILRHAPNPSATIAVDCALGYLTVDHQPVPISFSTTVDALLDGDPIEGRTCAPLELAGGEHAMASTARAAHGLTVDRVVLREPAPVVTAAALPLVPVEDDPRDRTYVVPPCPDECWFVLGEGFNDAWSATVDGAALADPVLVDGGFNGWLLPPSTTARTVEVRWTAQWPVTAGLAISALSVIALVAIVVLTWTGRLPNRRRERSVPRLAPTAPSAGVAAPALVVTSWLLVGWEAALLALPTAAAFVALRRRSPTHADRVLPTAGVGAATLVALGVTIGERIDAPDPGAGWPGHFAWLHPVAMFAVVAVAVAACSPERDRW